MQTSTTETGVQKPVTPPPTDNAVKKEDLPKSEVREPKRRPEAARELGGDTQKPRYPRSGKGL